VVVLSGVYGVACESINQPTTVSHHPTTTRHTQVGEHGIGAVVKPDAGDDVEGLVDDIKGADATIRAWRYIQLNTCTALAELYATLGRWGAVLGGAGA